MSALVKTDLVARAHEGWDGNPPDWVLELARAAMDTNQTAVAKRIGYSSSVVSQAISNTYNGDIARVETRVRGALLKEKVNCPVLVQVARHDCLDWQKKPWAPTSGLRVKLYRACRSGCPHSRLEKEY
jgi:uncharacterized protein involved in cysteine biosynthesis